MCIRTFCATHLLLTCCNLQAICVPFRKCLVTVPSLPRRCTLRSTFSDWRRCMMPLTRDLERSWRLISREWELSPRKGRKRSPHTCNIFPIITVLMISPPSHSPVPTRSSAPSWRSFCLPSSKYTVSRCYATKACCTSTALTTSLYFGAYTIDGEQAASW